MEHYANYIKERENSEIIWNEDGFITYKILDNGSQVYIVDLYVIPEKRKTRVATNFANMVIEKNKECQKLWGSVSLRSNNPRLNIRVLRGYGFTFFKLIKEEQMLYFVKELG
jgi:hypothetical protein